MSTVHGVGDLLGHASHEQVVEQDMSLDGAIVGCRQGMDEGDFGGGIVVESHAARGAWMAAHRRVSFDQEFTTASWGQGGGKSVHVHVADADAVEAVQVGQVTMADADVDSGVVAGRKTEEPDGATRLEVLVGTSDRMAESTWGDDTGRWFARVVDLEEGQRAVAQAESDSGKRVGNGGGAAQRHHSPARHAPDPVAWVQLPWFVPCPPGNSRCTGIASGHPQFGHRQSQVSSSGTECPPAVFRSGIRHRVQRRTHTWFVWSREARLSAPPGKGKG